MKIYQVVFKLRRSEPIFFVVDSVSELDSLANKIYPDQEYDRIEYIGSNVINKWAQ